ncbi:hypothetical protein BH24ACT3_BH24ACT3_00640 [soil metagenome]
MSPRTDEPTAAATTPADATAEPASPVAELPAGAALGEGRFAIRRLLGRGGFGITYATDDLRLQRRVAIKELFPDGAVRHGSRVLVAEHARPAFVEARDRFLREAQVLARFTHPGIVRVYEVFEANGNAYFVMELVEGRTLAALLSERGVPLGEAEVLYVAGRSSLALAQVHAAGVLHRDLNPSNLVLTDHGRVVLIDFGIARDVDDGDTATMTRVVTPGYAPPEQYGGEFRFGAPTDVYGLAATLYRLLTGRVPTPAVDRQQGTALVPPHRLVETVSRQTSAAVLDGLELNPDHRPRTLDAFTARLGLAGEPRSSRSILVTGEHPPQRPAAVPPVDVPPAGAGVSSADSTATRADVLAGPTAHRPPPSVAPIPSAAQAYAPGPAYAPAPGYQPAAGYQPGGYAPPPHASYPPPLPGRWRLTLPVGVAAAALGSAAPVVMAVLLVVVALPALATAGDVLLARRRGPLVGGRWYHGAGLPVVVPVRVLRNLLWSVLRALPALGLGVVLVAVAVAVDQVSDAFVAREALLRIAGAVTVVLIGRPVVRHRAGSRAAVVTDVVHHRLETGPAVRWWWLWFGGLALTTLGLWWHPELWPLPG